MLSYNWSPYQYYIVISPDPHLIDQTKLCNQNRFDSRFEMYSVFSSRRCITQSLYLVIMSECFQCLRGLESFGLGQWLYLFHSNLSVDVCSSLEIVKYPELQLGSLHRLAFIHYPPLPLPPPRGKNTFWEMPLHWLLYELLLAGAERTEGDLVCGRDEEWASSH